MSYLVDRFGVLLVGFHLFCFWDRVLPYNPAWPDTQTSFWDFVQGARIMAVCHHTYLGFVLGFVSFCLLNYLSLESFLFLKMTHKAQWNYMLGPAIALDFQREAGVETAFISDLRLSSRAPGRETHRRRLSLLWCMLTYTAQTGLELLHSNNPLPWASQALYVEVLSIYLAPRTLLKRCFDIVKEKSFSGTKARSWKAVRDNKVSGEECPRGAVDAAEGGNLHQVQFTRELNMWQSSGTCVPFVLVQPLGCMTSIAFWATAVGPCEAQWPSLVAQSESFLQIPPLYMFQLLGVESGWTYVKATYKCSFSKLSIKRELGV